jgi:23S rRNA (adenine2503-C2)-methyltransferase
MFKLINSFGNDELAKIYLAKIDHNKIIEFVESRQPPLSWEDKWVFIISTSVGCPIKCLMCDAGGNYRGDLTTSQIFSQIDYLVLNRYPDFYVPVKKFKIQFARMGEPALNSDVLEVLGKLHERYHAPGLIPCISTIAPKNAKGFFEKLLTIKSDQFSRGQFQLQFSIHTTDETARDRLMPVKKWSLSEISEYGKRFYERGDRKITLNFALVKGIPLDPNKLARIFQPDYFMIKITPVNPTHSAIKAGLKSYIASIEPDRPYEVVRALEKHGFKTLISIGENEENLIGSNCGQYVMRHYSEQKKLPNSYTYINF